MDLQHTAPQAQTPQSTRNAIEWWIAKLDDGRLFTNGTAVGGAEFVASIDRVHERGLIRALSVKVFGHDDPISAECRQGERLHVFTQRALKWGTDGSVKAYHAAGIAPGETINMPVIEILSSGMPGIPRSDRTVIARLYVHPVYGKIFTTGTIDL